MAGWECMAGGHVWQGGVHGSGTCMIGGMRDRGHAWEGVCMAGGMHSWGPVWQGACVAGGMCGGVVCVVVGACVVGGMCGRPSHQQIL